MGTKKKAPKKRAAQKKLSPQQEARSESTSIERLAQLAGQSTALARLVARNPKASGPLLKKLGSHSDSTVRKWVTAHPNTPPRVLARLASQFPEQLLDNIAFDVLLLENPNLLRDLPKTTCRSLLKRERCPVTFLEWLAQDDDEGVQLALAMNANTPAHVLKQLAESSSEKVPRAARHHVNYPRQPKGLQGLQAALEAEDLDESEQVQIPQLLPWLVARGEEETGPARVLGAWVGHHIEAFPAARSSKTSDVMLERLATVKWTSIRKAVAGNTSTPAKVLERLAADRDKGVRTAVADNESTPAKALMRLATDKEHWVRGAVAWNASAPEKALTRLAKDKDHYVCSYVARNESTPAAVLGHLAEDGAFRGPPWDDIDSPIQVTVAKNASTPATVLKRLAGSECESLRRAVAWNESTPVTVLECLAIDKCADVRRAVAERRSRPARILERLADDNSKIVRLAVARNPSTPARVLERLADDDNDYVRDAVALNESTPAAILEFLAGDKCTYVRREVARNASTPSATLVRLAGDNCADVRMAVARNASKPSAMLNRLAEDMSTNVRRELARNVSTSPAALDRLARDKFKHVRRAVAGNKSTPAKVLECLAEDKDEDVRLAVAGNTSTPVRALLRLWEYLAEVVAPSTPVLEIVRQQYLAEVAPAQLDRVIRMEGIPKAQRQVLQREVGVTFVAEHGRSNQPSFKRLACLLLPDCPVAILAKAVRSSDWKERLAIACHPETPPATRKRLANDGNRFVRAAAQQAIEEISE